jgi:hypothetical protein
MDDKWLRILRLLSLALAVLLVITLVVAGLWPPGHGTQGVKAEGVGDLLTTLVGYATLILLFFFGLMVMFEMATGRIDLSLLLSEPDSGGKASMSRFQLLIFTFVIAFSLFLITVSTKKFPAVPPEILTLLGISASTYAVSKGINASNSGTAAKHADTAQGAAADAKQHAGNAQDAAAKAASAQAAAEAAAAAAKQAAAKRVPDKPAPPPEIR